MFKYSEEKFIDLMCRYGHVRIGTLHDYRKGEIRGVSDINEGSKEITHTQGYLYIEDSDNVGDLKNNIDYKAIDFFNGKKIEKCKGLTMSGNTFSKKIVHPNCFVYCTSVCYSEEVMKKFENASSCAWVSDISRFYNIITEHLTQKYKVINDGLTLVKYKPRAEKWNGFNNGVSPLILKEEQFSGQYEIRAFWNTKEQNIEPVYITDFRLCACVKKLNISHHQRSG